MKRYLFLTLLWPVASLTLFLCVWTTEAMILPPWAEGVGTMLGRLAHVAIIPGRRMALLISSNEDFHWSTAHWLLSSLFTPPFLFALGWAIHRVLRRPLSAPPSGPEQDSSDSPSRRHFVLSGAIAAVAVAGGGTGVYAVAIAPVRLRVVELDLPIAGLPSSLDGLRVAHISDTHHGPFISLSHLRRVIRTVNALQPDLVLLTGDYVHRTPRSIQPGISVLGELRPRLASMAVLGNHDHWEGADACRSAFERIGIPLVDNTRVFVTAQGLRQGVDGDALCVGGVGDLWEDVCNPGQALAGVPVSTPRLLLSHNPDVAETLPPDLRVDLMLSGHTHGGQVRLPLIGTPIVPSDYGQRYAGGLVEGPRCRVLVSRGVGAAILPLRFRVPPEVGLVTLRRG